MFSTSSVRLTCFARNLRLPKYCTGGGGGGLQGTDKEIHVRISYPGGKNN